MSQLQPQPKPIIAATADACTHALLDLGDSHDLAAAVNRIAVTLRAHVVASLREHYASKPAHAQPPTDAAIVDEAHHIVRRMWTAPLDAIAGGPNAVHVNIREGK